MVRRSELGIRANVLRNRYPIRVSLGGYLHLAGEGRTTKSHRDDDQHCHLMQTPLTRIKVPDRSECSGEMGVVLFTTVNTDFFEIGLPAAIDPC